MTTSRSPTRVTYIYVMIETRRTDPTRGATQGLNGSVEMVALDSPMSNGSSRDARWGADDSPIVLNRQLRIVASTTLSDVLQY